MLILFLALALVAESQDAAQLPVALPVSLEHIRQGLQRTPALRIDTPMPEPTFPDRYAAADPGRRAAVDPIGPTTRSSLESYERR